MADVINLRRARKDKARREHEREAAANRQRFGRTKAQKSADQNAAARGRPRSTTSGWSPASPTTATSAGSVGWRQAIKKLGAAWSAPGLATAHVGELERRPLSASISTDRARCCHGRPAPSACRCAGDAETVAPLLQPDDDGGRPRPVGQAIFAAQRTQR
jgi:hypothetical protein